MGLVASLLSLFFYL